jgi:hypothetical protein
MATQRKPKVDLDAVVCVDMGHHWDELYFGRADSGILQGMPVRLVVCSVCHSHRLDYLTWDGRVTHRRYDSDEAYITNARALSDVFYDRRKSVRQEKAKRLKQSGPSGDPGDYGKYVQ